MTVTLLFHSDSESSSLEFASEDIESVRQAILDLFGDAASEQHTTYCTLRFGGEKFLLQNEWDDPCLIAFTEAGRIMLAKIEGRLSEKKPG